MNVTSLCFDGRAARSFRTMTMCRFLTAITLLAVACTTPADAGRDFEATESDFRCLTEGRKVPGRNFYVQHRNKRKLKKALRVTAKAIKTGKTGFRYPVGTILQLFPFEAMVKREKGFNPGGGDWEYFRLGISPTGTTIAARGKGEVGNAAGSCQTCHATLAAQYDYVCEFVVGTSGLGLTDAQVAAIQAADPRCASGAAP
jgi:hypothetical protein